MKVTPEHRRIAQSLIGGKVTASASFLSAIERLEGEDQERVGPTALWTDRAGDGGQAYPFDGGITLRLTDSAPTEVVEATHVLDADEAERRGWELIALAFLARSGS